ncbi:MAG: 2-amino-4-hydroxy-6-hydroxymethyldihydropteridine diphosphokinase [Mycobacterium sp.]
MTGVVLSIGSNLGDRLARLQSVVDGLGPRLIGVSRVYETDPWGGVDQGHFLNAVVSARDPSFDGHGWLAFGQELERAADRVRDQRWGPRTLDVDVVSCRDGDKEISMITPDLALPHPLAHMRAFVLVPWLDLEPDAHLTVGGQSQSVARLLTELPDGDRDGVRLTEYALVRDPAP